MEELQNIFKANLNERSKGRFKSKEQINALKLFKKLLYKSHQTVIKLFFFKNCYSSNVSEVKHKVKYGKGLKILSLNKCFKDFR